MSNSLVDNVEHIWIPDLGAGADILASVYLGSALPDGRFAEPYARSWQEIVPAPGVGVLILMGVAAAAHRRRAA